MIDGGGLVGSVTIEVSGVVVVVWGWDCGSRRNIAMVDVGVERCFIFGQSRET